jgi:diaminopimelate epimerase
MRFVKMHGIGNDYVYVDAVSEPEIGRRKDLPALARQISDRHTGVGSDGLILVCKPTNRTADVRMRMWNSDGSESEMCGNGVRCVAKFAHDRLGLGNGTLRVQTGRGVLPVGYTLRRGRVAEATVDMGAPILALPHIPVLKSRLTFGFVPHHWGVCGEDWGFVATFVSMGNPHAVVFENGPRDFTRRELGALDLARVGPAFEKHPAFPKRINAHFVAPVSRKEAVVRTWERGAGATMACGTGACAVAVAGVLTGRMGRAVLLRLPGGTLKVRWDERTKHVFMTGPAEDVFEGEWPD